MCVFLTEEHVAGIRLCNSDKCSKDKDLDIKWRMVMVSPSTKVQKASQYFVVKAMRDDPEHPPKRSFLIEWGGYSPKFNSWEPEAHLDGCHRLLQEYCKDNHLPYSAIIGVVGATPRVKGSNVVNWNTPNRDLSKFRERMEQLKLNTSLEVTIWDHKLNNEDSIYLVQYQSHSYIVLHYVGKNIGQFYRFATVSYSHHTS